MPVRTCCKQGVPPFIICSDKTLKDMCARCPADKTQMADVYGMGAQKIASYGESFAEIIRMFLQTHESGNMTTGKTEGAAVVEIVSKPPAGKKETAVLYCTGKIRSGNVF